jgi:hypothetical protein
MHTVANIDGNCDCYAYAQRDSDRNAYTNSNRNSDTDCNAYNNLDPDDHANSDFNAYGCTEAYSDPKG